MHSTPCRMLFAAILLLAVPGAQGAEEKPNAMFDMFQHHWTSRVKTFQSQNSTLMNVVLLGDSITEGFDTAKHFPFRQILNRGIGADIIGNGVPGSDRRGVLKRMGPSLFDTGTSHVFLLIGINDIGDSRPLEVMEEGYRDILAAVRKDAPRVTVHVQSLLPTRGGFARHNATVIDFNGRLRRLAGEFGYPYLDLHSRFADEKGELKAELTNDGLHITEAGYSIWRQEIEKTMGW